MIAWTFLAFLAVAAAAPQLQLQQPLKTQITSAQPLQTQIIGAQPVQTQVYSGQPIQGEILRSTRILVPFRAVQPYSYNALPINSANLQTVPAQETSYNVPIKSSVSSLPVISSTIAPVTLRQQVFPQGQAVIRQQVFPQVQAVQQQVVPQFQTVQQQVVPQFQTVQKQVVPQFQTVQQQVVPQFQTVQQQVVPKVQTVAVPQQYQNIPFPSQYNYQGYGIVENQRSFSPDGSYAYSYKTENGIDATEEGRIVNQGTDNESNLVVGSYSYTAPDGKQISVSYRADANGFQATGDHIPQTPEAIQRALEYTSSLPARPEDQEGRYVPDKNGY